MGESNGVGESDSDGGSVSSYRQQVAQLEAEIKELTETSHELHEELGKELDAKEDEYQQLERRYQALQQEAKAAKDKEVKEKKEQARTYQAMQKEIESLREAHRLAKVQLRDVEVSNNDFEQNERIVRSSLEDMEAKYNAAIEKNAFLEAELASKENFVIENQRLRDELRDMQAELAVSRDRDSNSPPSPPMSESALPQPAECNLPVSPAILRIPRSGSMMKMQNLLGRVKNLEERLHSCRARLPVNTPPRAPSRLSTIRDGSTDRRGRSTSRASGNGETSSSASPSIDRLHHQLSLSPKKSVPLLPRPKTDGRQSPLKPRLSYAHDSVLPRDRSASATTFPARRSSNTHLSPSPHRMSLGTANLPRKPGEQGKRGELSPRRASGIPLPFAEANARSS